MPENSAESRHWEAALKKFPNTAGPENERKFLSRRGFRPPDRRLDRPGTHPSGGFGNSLGWVLRRPAGEWAASGPPGLGRTLHGLDGGRRKCHIRPAPTAARQEPGFARAPTAARQEPGATA